MKLKPHSDFVLIKKDPAEKVSEGGIHLLAPVADGTASKLRSGTVLAVGPGRWSSDGSTRLPMSVKPKDRVLFSPVFSGVEKSRGGMTALGAEELILRDTDCWAITEEG